eukprot:gene19570-21501_t
MTALLQAMLVLLACSMCSGCNKNSDCASGFCDGGTFWTSGTCRALVADGKLCLQNGDSNSCVSKQCTCSYCGRKMAAGYKCSTNDNCISGWCHGTFTAFCKGTCKSRVADGGTCLSGGDSNSCVSLQCTCGKCGKKLPNGYQCSSNDNCKSGWCDGQVTIGCGGKCKRLHEDYEACPLNLLGSGDNNICRSKRCEKVSPTEALCAPKQGFRAGTKCNEDTDCDKTKSMWCSGGSFLESGKCVVCPANCPDGCNALFNQNLKCGRMTTFDHAADVAKKIAEPLLDFVKCLSPATGGCLTDIGKGVASCLDTSKPCKIKLGGKGSTCLAVNSAKQSYSYTSGPLTMTGSVEPTGGASLETDLTDGKINIGLHGNVAVKASIKVEVTKSTSIPVVKKRLYLTNCVGKACSPCSSPESKLKCRPLTLYSKVFMAGYLPVIIQVEAQVVADLYFEMKATGSFKAEISYDNEKLIGISKAIATFDPVNGVKFDVALLQNLDKQITKSVVVNAGVEMMGVLRIGTQLRISVNGIPLSMFLAARFVMEGKLALSQNCMTGSFSAGIGLSAGITADFSIPNPATLAGIACKGVVGGACMFPAVKVANCAIKVLTKVDPCKKAQGMCTDLERDLKSLMPENLGKTFTGTANLVKAKFTPFNLTGKSYCVGGQADFVSKAGSIGAGKLSGGGGGKGIQTCGAPGRPKCPGDILNDFPKYKL